MLENVFKDLMKYEGLALRVYTCPRGKPTIGYGRNLEDNGITKKEAELMLVFDISRLVMQLDKRVNFWKAQPVNIRIILLEMAYQLGVEGLLKFKKFLAALETKNYVLAKEEMFDSKWAMQTPKRVIALAKYLNLQKKTGDTEKWLKDLKVLREYANTIENMSILE